MGKRGGPQPGSGRPPKVQELKVINFLDETLGPDSKANVVKKLYEMALTGSYPHIQLYCFYRFGKPTEKIIIDQAREAARPFTPIINVIAPPDRVAKLLAAKQAAVGVADAVQVVDKPEDVGDFFEDVTRHYNREPNGPTAVR